MPYYAILWPIALQSPEHSPHHRVFSSPPSILRTTVHSPAPKHSPSPQTWSGLLRILCPPSLLQPPLPPAHLVLRLRATGGAGHRAAPAPVTVGARRSGNEELVPVMLAAPPVTTPSPGMLFLPDDGFQPELHLGDQFLVSPATDARTF